MVKLQDLLCELALFISPRTDDGVTITAATVGTTDTQALPKERLLAIYNRARTTLMGAILEMAPRSRTVAENIVESDIAFAAGVANKPTGCIRATLLRNAATKAIVPMVPASEEEDTDGELSTTNLFVIDQGRDLVTPDGTATYVTGNHKLKNVNVPQYTIANVIATAPYIYESFSEQWHTAILELGQAIFRSVGQKELNILARELVAITMKGGA